MNIQNNRYKEIQITSASPLELILHLYDGAVKFLHEAKKCLENGDIECRVDNINRVADIITELRVSLNFSEGKDAANGLNLFYTYLSNRLIEANALKSAPILDDIIRMFVDVRGSWVQVLADQQAAARPSQPPSDATLPTSLSA